jgi:hypothetical protein
VFRTEKLTDTILQTLGLQKLLICHANSFSAAAVIAWLSHTSDSLRHLTYKVPISTEHVNMLERCGRMRCLKSLTLRYADIRFRANPTAQQFLRLLSLSVSAVKVSELQVQSLVSACPKLQSFSLTDSTITSTNPRGTLNLTSSTLKAFFLGGIRLHSVILEANFLKKLGLAWCDFTNFKLVTKGACKLSSLSLKTVDIDHLDLGSHTHCLGLKKVEVKEPCSYVWTVVDSILSKPSLRHLQAQELLAQYTTIVIHGSLCVGYMANSFGAQWVTAPWACLESQ